MRGGPELSADEVRSVFGPEATSADLSVERVHEPIVPATSGIWRVRVGERSVILKNVAHSEGGPPQWRSGITADDWFYWRREVFAYESGLFDLLDGGLRAPKCYLIATRDDGSVGLWLEDLAGLPATRWPLGRYAIAAEHFGRAQGRFVTDEERLPTAAWLSRDWLRHYLRLRDADTALLSDHRLWADPLVAAWFPKPPIERLQQLRADQELFLCTVDAFPRTLCHLDLHPANLFADDETRTVAIDWSFVGIAAIGEDPGNLVADAVLDFHVAPDHIEDLYEAIATGYTAGLRTAGARMGEAEIRRAMAASIAAKYSWIAPGMLRAISDRRELLNHRPIEETLHWWVPTIEFILERADEARRPPH